MATLNVRHDDRWYPVQMVAYLNDIANQYDAGRNYSVGDLCAHELRLYRCISATTGEWDSTKWEHATVDGELQTKASKDDLTEVANSKQNKLSAGTGITIRGSVISADALTKTDVTDALGFTPAAETDLDSKADKSTVDSLAEEVDRIDTDLSQTKEEIANDLSEIKSDVSNLRALTHAEIDRAMTH